MRLLWLRPPGATVKVKYLTHCPNYSNQTPDQIEFEWDTVEARLTLHCEACSTVFTVVYVVACVEDIDTRG